MANAISWFEISTTQLDQAQTFYESVLGRPMRREVMGSSQGTVFAYDQAGHGVGGALMMRPSAPACLPWPETRRVAPRMLCFQELFSQLS